MKVTLRLEPLGVSLATEAGTPLRDLLVPFGVEFPCGGKGNCGRCRVRFLEGDLDWRLACHEVASADATIEIGQFETPILADNRSFTIDPRPGFGIAFDLGTTTLVGQLVDLSTGAVLAVRTALNPQAAYGADIMTRVEHALHGGGVDLRDSIRGALESMAVQLADGREVESAVVAGNTVMLHLLAGLDVEPLSHAPFEPAQLDCGTINGFRLLPCIGGFVGSDILAGIVATGLHQNQQTAVLIDLGTNGEVVVAHRGQLLAASTAAGPAFEGGRISCGMRASSGAISEVGDGLRCAVIGGGQARGICGSGLVDAAAVALDLGLLGANGRIQAPIELADGIRLTQGDIRELQLAKGAVAAGVQVLLARLGARPEEVERVWLAGAFGNYVNRASARRIGLIEFPESVVESAGNTALLGAKIALFSDLYATVDHVSLGADPEFQDHFVDCLAFPV